MTMTEAAADAGLARHARVLPPDNVNGYRSFEAGSFTFKRDEYFARITWPTGSHVMAIDYGESGYGREMGFEAMREYTQPKSVWINVDAEIPPYYRR